MNLWDLLPDFMIALDKQLKKDQERHGDRWKELPREGQEQRIFARFHVYHYDFASKGTPIPWLKIAGLALIGWTRDKHAKQQLEEK